MQEIFSTIFEIAEISVRTKMPQASDTFFQRLWVEREGSAGAWGNLYF